MKLVVFSICKDESATIGKLLDQIPTTIAGIDEIETIVISDGSTDDTVQVAKDHGAIVIDGQNQKRLAARFIEAVALALDHGADMAVNIDGDLQFDPGDIPELVAPIVSGGFDFVAADRFTDAQTGKRRKPTGMPTGKNYANQLGAWVVGKLSGQHFNDVTCGFRAYNRKALLSLNINSNYTYTQESFQVLATKRLSIKTLPVAVKYYPGRKSRVVTSFFSFLFGSAFNIIRAYRDFRPLSFFGTIAASFFALGLVGIIFTALYWLNTGAITPYKTVGLAGIYFATLGLIFGLIALLADMLKRTSNNQEKILELLKEIKYRNK
jgi:glycosyltransferase involved in cell wall biosynthesis